MDALGVYGSDDSADEAQTVAVMSALKKKREAFTVAPIVAPTRDIRTETDFQPTGLKEVKYNPTFEAMSAPAAGPIDPAKVRRLERQNLITGYYEDAALNPFHFDNQRKTFDAFGYAADPMSNTLVGDLDRAAETHYSTIHESSAVQKSSLKRKRAKKGTAGEDDFRGPWAGYVGEDRTKKPTDEEMALWEEQRAGAESRKAERRAGRDGSEPVSATEESKLHCETTNYAGHSFMRPPQDTGKLLNGSPPEKCYVPKKLIHTYRGHTKGVQAIRLFPVSGHMFLSAGLDGKVKLWESYKSRRCIRTYLGHEKAVRDIAFNNDGTKFLTASFDRFVKLWDTETGKVISRFTTGKTPYCCKFNPNPDKQHMIVAGCSDKKIVQWDVNTGEVVQEYDRHLGSVNTITFVEGGNRFVTTSDDKSIRIWEWEIPVDMKYIADPAMHSMPSVALHPNGKWMIMQGMDNIISVYGAKDRFRLNAKKKFRGHLVAGFACGMSVSPDGSYVASGDSEGRLAIWDWKTSRLFSKERAHEKACMDVAWLPCETSSILTCGWDNTIKLWA